MNDKEEIISLLRARKEDIESVISYMNDNNKRYSPTSKRKLMFIYLNCISYLRDDECVKLLRDISQSLNNESLAFLKMLEKKAKYYCYFFSKTNSTKYMYTNDTIISALCIDEDIIRKLNLKTIITEKIMLEREEEKIKNILEK
ncbi:MAG: hypothetical protein J6K42_07560 [Clostridia bacterium]|nr:hypothetical protein [Clostridia bacterium]